MPSNMNDQQSASGNSKKVIQPENLAPSSEEPASQGPSLKVLYAILVFVLGVAIMLAMMIVLPFWRRN